MEQQQLLRPNKHALLAVLSRHIGRETALDAQALVVALGCNSRVLRQLVTELRNDGIAVCGHPSVGYFIAANAEELEQTCAFLRSRAMHSLLLESKLRKVPLVDLLGQLRLPT